MKYGNIVLMNQYLVAIQYFKHMVLEIISGINYESSL